VNFINAGRNVVTEISPQSYCGSLSSYKSLISDIKDYVETYSSNPGTRWAGIMLDEEGGYGFTASQLESLNWYTAGVMLSTPGLSWFFTENQPNSWVLSTYEDVVGISWAAPQVYSTSMANTVNGAYNGGVIIENLITFWTGANSPWNAIDYTKSHIHGQPWYDGGYWLDGYWTNHYSNV